MTTPPRALDVEECGDLAARLNQPISRVDDTVVLIDDLRAVVARALETVAEQSAHIMSLEDLVGQRDDRIADQAVRIQVLEDVARELRGGSLPTDEMADDGAGEP